MQKKKIIIKLGKPVLESNYFKQAESQNHHIRSNVASHSINTAICCLVLYKILSFFKININLKVLIVAALAHDIGILGRKEKFSTGHECILEHPVCSVNAIKEIEPDVDNHICNAIASHMYPLGGCKPKSKEAWILTIADKCAACTDHFFKYDRCDFIAS